MNPLRESADTCVKLVCAVIDGQMQRYIGKRVRMVKDWRDQPHGKSRPNLKGNAYQIIAISGDMDRVNFWLQGLQCALPADYLELL